MSGVGYSRASVWPRPLLVVGWLAVVVAVFIHVVGCAPRAPVVANPIEPWEQQVERERVAQREQEQKERAGRLRPPPGGGYGVEEEKDEHSPIVTALADIVAFPIRGAAWLAHTLL